MALSWQTSLCRGQKLWAHSFLHNDRFMHSGCGAILRFWKVGRCIAVYVHYCKMTFWGKTQITASQVCNKHHYLMLPRTKPRKSSPIIWEPSMYVCKQPLLGQQQALAWGTQTSAHGSQAPLWPMPNLLGTATHKHWRLLYPVKLVAVCMLSTTVASCAVFVHVRPPVHTVAVGCSWLLHGTSPLVLCVGFGSAVCW